MVDAKAFFQCIDKVARAPWKVVYNYRIMSPEIARGDYSILYIAESGGRKFAVKIYSAQWVIANELSYRNETSAFEKLRTLEIIPNIVQVPLLSTNNAYIFTELCNAGSLDMHLHKGVAFPLSIIKDVAHFVAEALLKMSSIRYIHRDIAPKHIFVSLDQSGKPFFKLGGLRFCKDITTGMASSFSGTPEYMAPEIYLKIPYGFEVDVWSLGITLYELATGSLITRTNPGVLEQLRNGVPLKFPFNFQSVPALRDLINKCLTRDPKQRITPARILSHPFLLENPKPQPVPNIPAPPRPIAKEGQNKSPVKTIPKAPEQKAISKPVKLDENQLMDLITKDFTKFIQYVNETDSSGIKLKAERRETLDPYELKAANPLGVGGFGEIYLCAHKSTGITYALKLIKSSKMTNVKVATLLLGEVQIMVELSSCPFVLKIEDYFVYGNNLCLILEYCNGGDLDNYIRRVRRKKNYPIPELKLVAWNIASGLYEMHKRKMMHRDIKPGNILLIVDDKTKDLIDVKMCDYGLSKKVADCDPLQACTVLGTYDYFAPELYEIMEKRIAGHNVKMEYTYKIDVWSYGVLLYFTLYGRTIMEPPGSKLSVMKNKVIEYPPIAGIPESYIQLVKKTLTFDPSIRPSFADILNDPFFSLVLLKPQLNLFPYVQGNLIGHGSTEKTRVYECNCNGKTYAMKVIYAGGAEEKRMVGEIDTLTKLKNSNNVIKLYDYFGIEGTIYLIFDYYKDGNLEQYISRRESKKAPLSSEEQIFLAYNVINGINEIHSRNIIHRDIHPKNVLMQLADTGAIMKVLIGDFGFARILLDSTAQTMILTPYHSPEMMKPGRVHDSKTDIWSFGMLLYFIIFGIDSDKHANNYSLSKIIKKGSVDYDPKRAEKSPELIKMMNLCLQANPKERPTAAELLKNPIFSKCTSPI